MKRFKKYWITIWMISALLLFFSLGAYIIHGAYLGNSELKRVVSTRSLSDVVFSSNVMKAPTIPKNLHEDDASKDFTYPVTVCNFDQTSPSNYATETITYTLTAQLVEHDGSAYVPLTTAVKKEDGVTPAVFKIQQTGNDNASVSGTAFDLNRIENGASVVATFTGQSLAGTAPMTDTFTLTFDKGQLANEDAKYFIHITATPAENTAISGTLNEISAWVSVSRGKVYGSEWSGVIIEKSLEYDAYNMQLTGAGKGTVEIRWNSYYFTITDMFLFDSSNSFVDGNGDTVTGDSAILDCNKGQHWKKVILEVDSYSKTNKYDIQFFKTTNRIPSGGNVEDYIETGGYNVSGQ